MKAKLAFPKKAASSMTGVSLASARKRIPTELKRALIKALKKLGITSAAEIKQMRALYAPLARYRRPADPEKQSVADGTVRTRDERQQRPESTGKYAKEAGPQQY